MSPDVARLGQTSVNTGALLERLGVVGDTELVVRALGEHLSERHAAQLTECLDGSYWTPEALYEAMMAVLNRIAGNADGMSVAQVLADGRQVTLVPTSRFTLEYLTDDDMTDVVSELRGLLGEKVPANFGEALLRLVMSADRRDAFVAELEESLVIWGFPGSRSDRRLLSATLGQCYYHFRGRASRAAAAA